MESCPQWHMADCAPTSTAFCLLHGDPKGRPWWHLPNSALFFLLIHQKFFPSYQTCHPGAAAKNQAQVPACHCHPQLGTASRAALGTPCLGSLCVSHTSFTQGVLRSSIECLCLSRRKISSLFFLSLQPLIFMKCSCFLTTVLQVQLSPFFLAL